MILLEVEGVRGYLFIERVFVQVLVVVGTKK